ncbi:TonB-dependent receptor [Sediminicola luteus]|uniref:TonB-dependent receptor plug domain-containing protein n=1 Tax=Sediminicola luteus TaxID=319238 RepID=A0A2A4GCQ7_9FLAO|nr:Plug domain-containing protein [Sediminicola luteus]PCE66729.1 hypothetical protein B7P33_05410 [Sediminicola luteus]
MRHFSPFAYLRKVVVLPTVISISLFSFAQYSDTVQEQLYLHLSKHHFDREENIFFKVYLQAFDSNGPIPPVSKVAYIELRSPSDSLYYKKMVLLDRFSGFGALWLPTDLAQGPYTLKAYTRFMEHSGITKTESKIFVGKQPSEIGSNATEKPSITFYPEGGRLVVGIPSQLGVQMRGSMTDSIEAKVVDGSRNNIGGLKLMPDRTNLFLFTPQSTEEHTLIIKGPHGDWRYPLPRAQAQGVGIRVLENENEFRVFLKSTLPLKLENMVLILWQNHVKILNLPIDQGKQTLIVPVAKKHLAPGLATLELINDLGETVLVRKVFIDPDRLALSLSPYTNTDKNEVQLRLEANGDWDQKTDLSVSIHRFPNSARTLLPKDSQQNLKPLTDKFAQLLLADGQEREIVLLTDPIYPPTYSTADLANIEKGLTVSGQVVSKSKKKRDLQVNLLYKTKDEVGFDHSAVDNDGRFTFSDLFFTDSTELTLKVSRSTSHGKHKIKSLYGHTIVMDSVSPKDFAFLEQKNSSIASVPTKNPVAEMVIPEGVNRLDEVVLEDEAIDRKAKERDKQRIMYNDPTYTVEIANLKGMHAFSLGDILRMYVPNISGGNGKFYLRNSGVAALILWNGTPISSNPSSVFDIDYVDILTGPKAAIYGSRAAGGIVAIYTKRGNYDVNEQKAMPDPGFKITLPGLPSAKDYTITEQGVKEGLVYWNPNLTTDVQGKISIALPFNDDLPYYLVDIRGIKPDGSVLHFVERISYTK